MNKKITHEQIVKVLQIIYNTNIAAQTFDGLKKLLLELPVIEEEKKEAKEQVLKKEKKN